MTKMTKAEKYYRYAQLATAYTFTKAMREAGIPGDLIVDVNWLAHAFFKEAIDRYTGTMETVPDGTYGELAELEYDDLTALFQEESDRINIEVFGATAEELGHE